MKISASNTLDNTLLDTFRYDFIDTGQPLSTTPYQDSSLVGNPKLDENSHLFNLLSALLLFNDETSSLPTGQVNSTAVSISPLPLEVFLGSFLESFTYSDSPNLSTTDSDQEMLASFVFKEGEVSEVRHLIYCLSYALREDCFKISDDNIISFWGDDKANSGAFDIQVSKQDLNQFLAFLFKETGIK